MVSVEKFFIEGENKYECGLDREARNCLEGHDQLVQGAAGRQAGCGQYL